MWWTCNFLQLKTMTDIFKFHALLMAENHPSLPISHSRTMPSSYPLVILQLYGYIAKSLPLTSTHSIIILFNLYNRLFRTCISILTISTTFFTHSSLFNMATQNIKFYFSTTAFNVTRTASHALLSKTTLAWHLWRLLGEHVATANISHNANVQQIQHISSTLS